MGAVLQVNTVYFVENGMLDYADGRVAHAPNQPAPEHDDTISPVNFIGVQRGDVGIFATRIGLSYGTDPMTYLVSRVRRDGTGIGLPDEYVEADPARHSTPYLRRMLGQLPIDDVLSFGLPNLAEYLEGVRTSRRHRRTN